jgi:YidC/Oxa1 family membrane protein insertase
VGNLLGTIFGPIGTIFNAIFYEPIYNVLMLIYNVMHAIGIPGGLGLSIIALTLLVRCCMIPLTRKQLKSSRAMQELAPQLNALKVQYRGDPQGLMKAQQDLYKEHGYSPVSGCLPLLIQMPFLYALLFSFRTLLTESSSQTKILEAINKPIYSFLPHLTAIPDPYFLWVNLAKPDPIHILPFLAALFTFIQLRMAMPVRKKPAPGTPTDPTAQATQTTMYIMPAITFFIGLGFPAGLALYWTVGAMFASVQQYFLAGWGSLFLGIKGLEHLVPPPRDLPSSNVAIASSSRGAPTGARSLVASSSSTSSTASGSSPAEGGLRGFFRQFRDLSAAATQQAEETARAKNAAKNGTVVDSTATVDARSARNNGTAPAANADGTRETAGGGSSAGRRTRPSTKAMLVKPASSADLPEQAIQRDGKDSDSASFNSGPLPEVAISNAAENSPAAASASHGAGSGARTRVAAAGASSRPAGNKSNGNNGNAQRRASGGAGKGPGYSSARNRSSNNRAKGGR